MLTIYGDPGSRAARCLWALEELGLAYDRKDADLPNSGGRSPEYLSINPSGKVPFLIDNGLSVSESYAINLYLAQKYGSGSLWPDDIAAQVTSLQWSFWVATETEPFIAALYAERFQKSEVGQSATELDRLNAGMATRLAFLDAALRDRRFLAGDRFTIGDLNVAAGLRNAERLQVALSPHPHLHRWLTTCLTRPAHAHVLSLA